MQEIIAQNYNHPSVVMWGIFSRLWTRGNDVTPYLAKLNAAAHALDRSRPTVACSDQDGNINFITDLIVWRQDVGWRKGTTDDVTVWRDQLQKKLVTPPLGNLLRGQRLHRTQELYGTGGTPRELDARRASDTLPRAVRQEPPE